MPVSSEGLKPLTRNERETLREGFRPKKIRLLFVGEAPPASGRFFYSRNSGLYRAVREAFQTIDPRVTDDNFLHMFQAAGCYLTDLCPEPVDQLDSESRHRARRAAEQVLAGKLIELQPGKVASLLRSIAEHVANAASRVNWQGEILRLPYPGRWSRYRAEFVKMLEPSLRQLLDSHKCLSLDHRRQRRPMLFSADGSI